MTSKEAKMIVTLRTWCRAALSESRDFFNQIEHPLRAGFPRRVGVAQRSASLSCMRIIKSTLPESDFGACRCWRDSIAGWCKSSCRHRAQFDRIFICMRRTGKSLWRKCDKRRNCWLANQFSARRSRIQERANYLCICGFAIVTAGENERVLLNHVFHWHLRPSKKSRDLMKFNERSRNLCHDFLHGHTW